MDMNKYVGETKVLDNGREATIIAFRDFYDIDVQLSTGEISMHQQYYDFQTMNSAALGFYKKPVQNKPSGGTICKDVDLAAAYLYDYLPERGKMK